MTQNAQVSVILPTHNRAKIVGRAIRSVLAQSFTDLELIVVDDASSDNTADVVRQFKDPRLVYHQLERNSGAAVARNSGAQQAHGSLLAFQDSDDEWLVDKLARQLDAIRTTGADLMCCGYVSIHAKGSVTARRPEQRMQVGDWGVDNIYDFGFITPTWLITRDAFEALGGFDVSMPNLEDWEMSFRLFKAGRKILALDELLMFKHAGGQDSLNWKGEPRIQSLRHIIDRHHDIWVQHPPSYAKLYEELGRWQLRAGKLGDGRSSLCRAISQQPMGRKRWQHLVASFAGQRIYTSLLRKK